jgi:hypothetical protein
MMAATIEPEIEPNPPNTTITTTSNDLRNRNMSGLRYIMKWAKRPPATPARNDPMMNAFTLYLVVSTPIASAAI